MDTNFIKMKKLIVLFSISFVVSLFSCNKNYCVERFQYTLNHDMYANNDTINIGDTVFLDIDIPTRLKDELSGEIIQFPDKLLWHAIKITRIDKDSVSLSSIYSTGAILDFDTLLFKGSLAESFHLWSRDINLTYKGGRAIGHFGFIAKSSGTFVFDLFDRSFWTFDDPLSTYDIYLNDHDCTEWYWHSLYINNNTDNNYYIIQQHHVHYDTTTFEYSEYKNEANKNFVLDMKKNLQYGTFSVVVK